MGIKIVGGNFSGNRRDGIRVEGDVDVEIINPNSENNGGQGINIIQSPSIMRQLGLPDDTNPEELFRLLIAVRSAPGNQKEGIIKNSSLWGKFGSGALNTTTLISNLINIATNPQLVQAVMSLLK